MCWPLSSVLSFMRTTRARPPSVRDASYRLTAAPRDASATAAACAAGATVATSATAIGYYPDDGGLLAVATRERLVRVTARAHVYATGGYAQNLLFENNDRPGVIAARAAGRMMV